MNTYSNFDHFFDWSAKLITELLIKLKQKWIIVLMFDIFSTDSAVTKHEP